MVTYKHRKKYSIKNKVRRTSNVFDVDINNEALPQEFTKAKKLRIHNKHVSEDPEQVPLYHGTRGSLSAPEDGDDDAPFDIMQREAHNPLYMEHEVNEAEDTEVDVLDATATTGLISGQK